MINQVPPIELTSFPLLSAVGAGERKRVFVDFLFLVIRQWAEAHGYKSCVPSGHDSTSYPIYLHK